MAMKEKIKFQRDLHLERIQKSDALSNEDKVALTNLVVEASEGTNGLTEHDKLQNVSESTFYLTTAIVNLTENLNRNNVLTEKVARRIDEMEDRFQKIDTSIQTIKDENQVKYSDLVAQVQAKRNIKELNWSDTMKLVLVKPWVWIFAAFFVFSPKAIDILQMAIEWYSK